MAKSSNIEIDVTLNMDGIGKDFNELEKKAKAGTRSVVKAVGQISDAMEETGTEAKKAGEDYEKSAEGMERSAKEAAKEADDLKETMEDTTDSTDGLKDSEDQLGRQSKKTSEEQEGLGDKTEETRQKVEASKESFIDWGEAAKTAVRGVVIVSGTLLSAMGAGAGAAANFGIEYQQASNSIQASTGATKEEMEGLRDVMKNVYANNFGEDMNDVAEAVATVKKNISGTDEEIQKATESAFGFRDTFGYEIPESTRAAKAMMDIFNISAEEAYDLMAKGAQNGLDYSGELLDNISEYSVQFGKAGLSAEDMFNIMQAGADSGAWNLDKIGDAVKELNIRLVDGSETTKEGLEAIGMNADEVAKKMSEGGDTARETYKKVVESLAEMDDKQAKNIAGVNLFGTMWEDLGPEVVAQLATMEGAYDDVKETMDEINQVKYDDAGNALEALKRKTETSLLFPISEDIMPAISEATNAAIAYIDELASAYESEGVSGLVEEAGNIFSDIATSAAEQAPQMVDVAVSFIDNAVTGFQENSGRLVEAGGNLVKSLAGAAVQLLPTELQEPVEEAVNDLVDSLTGGGVKNGLETFGTMFENGFKAVANVTKTVLPPFVKIVDKTADHMDVLIPLVAAGAAAYKGWSIVDGVTKSLKTSMKVIDLLTVAEKKHTVAELASTTAIKAKDLVIGVITGKIKLATAATAAWNGVLTALGGPIGLVVMGVAAAGAALAAYALTSRNSTDETGKLTEAEQKLKDRVHEQAEAYRELKEEREKQFETINAEFSNTQALADELSTIVDENGKIKEGYEDRAAVIVGLLNDALGTEIEITDGVIQKYGELKESIDEVILKKKAEAVQSAMQDGYAEAINNQTEAYMNYAEAQKNVEKTTKELEEAQEAQAEAQKMANSFPDFEQYQIDLRSATEKVEALEKKQKDQKETLSECEDTYVGYISTIQNYEGIVGAITSGDAAQIEEALLLATNSFITAETGTKESLEKQVENLKSSYEEMKKAVEEGAPGITQESVDEMKNLVDKSEEELAKFKDKAKKQGEDGITEYNHAIMAQEVNTKAVAEGVVEAARSTLASGNFTPAGAKGGDEYNSGIRSKSGESRSAGSVLESSARSGASSMGATDLGQSFGQGFINGIQSMVAGAARVAASMAANAAAAVQQNIDSHSPSKKTRKFGQYFGQGFTIGVVDMTPKAVEAAGIMARKSVNEFQENMHPFDLGFDIDEVVHQADSIVQERVTAYSELQRNEQQEKATSDNFKKKADYLISGFRKVMKEQGDPGIYWNNREVGRMFREVLEV